MKNKNQNFYSIKYIKCISIVSIYLLFKNNIMKECDFPQTIFYRTDNNFIALHFAENNVQYI